MQHIKRWSCLLVVVLSLLAGCASPTLEVPPVAISDNPSSKIFELEETLAASRVDQVNVLSPTWYAKAENALDKARYGLAYDDSVAGILTNVAYGHAYLEKAKEYAQIARSTIPNAIKARTLASAAGAASYASDFKDMEDQFMSLTMDIENNNIARAEKYEDKVAQGYADLELRAIKEKTLGEVRSLLATAETNGADRLAPKTLIMARNTLQEADQFITEQRYESEKMQEKAKQALFQAQRLGQIMDLSQKVGLMDSEDIALWSEGRLQQITMRLAARDLRNETPGLQLQNIIESIASLKDDNNYLQEARQQDAAEYATKLAELEAQLEEQRKQIATLEGKSKEVQKEREQIALQEQQAKARLEAERRFQQLFDEVQGLFSKDQAEVYKQGDNLVIRLKAMQFPVGKDLIMPKNYALLSQVRKAIRTFGEPAVVIEGHTDSTGSTAINAQLSKNRAEAVRQYFIANGTLSADKITAIGYGSERPLAPNDTPERRAINRRIDVVIKTEKLANQ